MLLDQEVMDLLLVNLQIAATNQEFHAIIFLINKSENLLEAFRDNSCLVRVCWDTQHGMSLTATSLAIGKDGAIIPLDDRFD
jgi:hypothetical protein